MTWLAIAIGGALGSVARHAVNQAVHARWLPARFPAGTLVVNVVGCFVVGLLAGFLASNRITMRVNVREFVFVGVLGGFTTFSAFGLETLLLSRTEPAPQAMLNVAAHVGGGLLAVWAGYQLGLSKP